MPVFQAIVAHFGEAVVGSDGELNRPALADIVFNDPEELKKINELVHPAVRNDMAHQREVLSRTHKIIVLDIPLLIESENPIEVLPRLFNRGRERTYLKSGQQRHPVGEG